VLIGLITAATNEIRVGSVALQIGHHTAAAVVEASVLRSKEWGLPRVGAVKLESPWAHPLAVVSVSAKITLTTTISSAR
jgi:hypothetical protein